MELIHWEKVDRKRSHEIPYDNKDFVRGYDLDMADFALLVEMFNQRQLSVDEESRLYSYVMTMLNIIFENPKINPRNTAEKKDCADSMFLDCWNALKYIKGSYSPYSYIYRAGYTAACRYFKKKIADRKKNEAIEEHLRECSEEYKNDVSDGRVYNVDSF